MQTKWPKEGEYIDLKLGRSFLKNDAYFHSIRYDFRPASIDQTKSACIELEEGNSVLVTIPNVESSGIDKTVYQGSRKPCQKDCVLIINKKTGEMILEKITNSMQVKTTRSTKNNNKVKVNHSFSGNHSNSSTPQSLNESSLTDQFESELSIYQMTSSSKLNCLDSISNINSDSLGREYPSSKKTLINQIFTLSDNYDSTENENEYDSANNDHDNQMESSDIPNYLNKQDILNKDSANGSDDEANENHIISKNKDQDSYIDNTIKNSSMNYNNVEIDVAHDLCLSEDSSDNDDDG